MLRDKLPLFYFGDVKTDNDEEYSSLNSPIEFDDQKNDRNNNRLLTPQALLTLKNDQMIPNANEQKHIVQAYRELTQKVRSLGK